MLHQSKVSTFCCDQHLWGSVRHIFSVESGLRSRKLSNYPCYAPLRPLYSCLSELRISSGKCAFCQGQCEDNNTVLLVELSTVLKHFWINFQKNRNSIPELSCHFQSQMTWVSGHGLTSRGRRTSQCACAQLLTQ